jgi:hypothetical protein
MPVIYFKNPEIYNLEDRKPQAKNLRLMLWAGDGMHGGITDVRRLPGYDVYLCAGWQDNLQANIDSLSHQQTLCVLDVHSMTQLTMFHHIYDGCFERIDSDYNGNTPTLPLTDYTLLLAPGGTARNIEGISGLFMPHENLYAALEVFAPILPNELQMKRKWCPDIMELSKRDDLHPSMVWSSPDLSHPYYQHVKEAQKNFETRQKLRSAAWPNQEPTLHAQWSAMNIKDLTCSFRFYAADETLIEKLLPHMGRFDEFLSSKIDELLTLKSSSFTIDRVDYANETSAIGDDILRVVNLKQTILKMLMKTVPAGMRAYIGCYEDDRYPSWPRCFGLRLRKDPVQ